MHIALPKRDPRGVNWKISSQINRFNQALTQDWDDGLFIFPPGTKVFYVGIVEVDHMIVNGSFRDIEQLSEQIQIVIIRMGDGLSDFRPSDKFAIFPIIQLGIYNIMLDRVV